MTDLPEREMLLAQFGGLTQILDKVVKGFLDTSPTHLAQMSEAVEAADARKLAKAAHTYKGSLGYFSQGALLERVRKIESLAKEENIPEARHVLPEIIEESQALFSHLRDMIE